jgi:hypothetical protein
VRPLEEAAQGALLELGALADALTSASAKFRPWQATISAPTSAA